MREDAICGEISGFLDSLIDTTKGGGGGGGGGLLALDCTCCPITCPFEDDEEDEESVQELCQRHVPVEEDLGFADSRSTARALSSNNSSSLPRSLVRFAINRPRGLMIVVVAELIILLFTNSM